MAGTQTKPRQGARLLPKLASLAIRHADLLVVTSCISGLIALLLLPALAKNTYISENALIPGSASPKFVLKDAADAAQIARELRMLSHNASEQGLLAVRSFLLRRLVAMGADFYLHPFQPPEPPFSSINFFSSQQLLPNPGGKRCRVLPDVSGRLGMNIVGLLRAPRGEGNEAIVLVTPFNGENLTDADSVSLGLGLALFHLLSKAAWLAKDIIWLAADSYHSPHFAVATWLKEYHEPESFHLDKPHCSIIEDLANEVPILLDELALGDFKRAGVIAAGLVFNVQELKSKALSDSLTVYAEGPNGQMPNLDLINVVNNLAIYREGLHMQLDTATSMLKWTWLHFVGQVLEMFGQVLGVLNSAWKFGLPAGEYVQGAAMLARSLSLQALGVPTGAHGAFRDYQIDAVTVVMSAKIDSQGGPVGSLMKFGRLLEGAIRSVNNLLEKFHQSFFLYFLTGPNRFVSVGVYTIPLLLLLATLPLKAAALCNQASGPKSLLKSAEQEETVGQRDISNVSEVDCSPVQKSLNFARWLFAVLTVCHVELWALLVAMCPLLVHHVAESPTTRMLLWIVFSVFSLTFLLILLPKMAKVVGLSEGLAPSYGACEDWGALKASTLGAATIGIVIMSSINFAAALAGAVLLVPMCLSVCPIQHLGKKKDFRSLIGAIVGVSFTFLSSFPVLFVLSMPLLSQKHSMSTAIMWSWVESMWRWGSATYFYFFLVHLPCSVLCHLLLLSNQA